MLFIEVSGLLPMCGHGTIGVATVLVETGMVEVTEPETVIRLDVPAGLVEARVRVENGRARSVTIRNVPSFLHARDRVVDVPGLGDVTYDMAYGGNFYAITPAADAGLVVDPARNGELIEAGLAVMAAINAADRPVHPEDPRISGCHHVVFHEPGRDGADAVAATSIHPGWLDRSPCGTGTSARHGAAARARRAGAGRADFVNESVIGTRFTGRAGRGDDRRRRARRSIPEITGRAWITGDGPVPARRRGPVPGGLRAVLDHRLDAAHQGVEPELEPRVRLGLVRQRNRHRDDVREPVDRQRREVLTQLGDVLRA